jgi:hypothetical protein
MTLDAAAVPAESDRLQYILGEHRVSLNDLTELEFQTLLKKVNSVVNLRELRGFRSLKETLSRSPGSFLFGSRQDPMEWVRVNPLAEIFQPTSEEHQFTLDTHVVKVSRGLLNQVVTYKRYESGEETTDWDVVRSWGQDCYVLKSFEDMLVVRRPRNHRGIDTNLFYVSYECVKVPHKDEMVIDIVRVKPVPVDNFRDFFGARYSRVARDMIWEFASWARQTSTDLKSRYEGFQNTVQFLDRVSESIME